MSELALIDQVDGALVKVEAAFAALVSAVDFQQTRKIRNQAIAAAAFAREAGDDRLMSKAMELRTFAERKAGQMLTAAAESGERATVAANGKGKQKLVDSDDKLPPPTLPDLGITRDQSSKWQAVGKLTDEEFSAAVEATKQVAKHVTTAAVVQIAKGKPRRAEPKRIAATPVSEPSDDEQIGVVYDAVRSLSKTTASAARLKAALPYYQQKNMQECIGPAIQLLKEIQKW